MESAAVSVLTRAVELDNKHRWTEAMTCYQEGLQLLMEAIKVMPDGARKSAFRAKATEYMDRAEKLKMQIETEKRKGKYHEQIEIEEDSVGHSYDSLLGRFLDASVTSVHVEDPYIRSVHQCYNLLRLCELCVRRCANLRAVHVLTSREPAQPAQQAERLAQMAQSLQTAGVGLVIAYSDTLHDRQIRLDSGWVIKIGRGLSYFKPPAGKFCLGYNDMDLRPCLQTTVDIFHQAGTVTSTGTS